MTNRSNFDNSLKNLQIDILKMGALVEAAIADAASALKEQNRELAEKVIANDNEIDRMETEIEDRCFILIATQQPMAGDLRKIAAGLKIIADLERIGDYACDIAKMACRIAGDKLIKPLIDIPKMAELTQQMVGCALDSYVREDSVLAASLAVHDDKVDHLHKQVFNELLAVMIREPATIRQASYLLFVCRYLERIGDHATNIGEKVIFLVTGERKDLNK